MDNGSGQEGAKGEGVAARFRGYLPVIVDVETGGFNAQTDALLEVAVVIIGIGGDGRWERKETHAHHIEPFPGARMDPKALEFNGIDPHHPFRLALPEREALQKLFQPVRQAVKAEGCTRAVLVGHNASFDLGFVNAAVQRCGIKRCPFHPFSCFDTATLGGLGFGQTVLSRAVEASGQAWDNTQAHSAIYDAERTADLFCTIVNLWDRHIGIDG